MRVLVIAVASVVLFFPTFWLFSTVVGTNWGAGIAAVAMYLAFPIIAMKAWPGKNNSKYISMEDALASGKLASATYEVGAAISVGQTEDEGIHFFLDVGHEKTLFLSGPYLQDLVENGAFPATHIRLYWHADLGYTYGVECTGAPVIATRMLPPFTEQHMRSGLVPEDRQVLNTSLQSAVDTFA